MSKAGMRDEEGNEGEEDRDRGDRGAILLMGECRGDIDFLDGSTSE
jgi:hypothetical protein